MSGPGGLPAEAARLAFHWRHAGDRARERPYVQLTADQLLGAGAYLAALTHLHRAIDLLDTITDPTARDEAELATQLGLGSAFLATTGHASPQMRAAFDRAEELCRTVGRHEELFRVLFGQSTSCLFRGELPTSLELAEQCLGLAVETGDSDLLVQSEFAVGNAAYWMADFPRALEKFDRVLSLYDHERHASHVQRFAHNPRVTCLTFGAWATWSVGRPERALALAEESLALAKPTGNPFAIAIAHQILGITHQCLRNARQTREHADALIAIPEVFPTYRIAGLMLRGWASVLEGHVAEGIEEMLRGWHTWTSMGAGLAHGYYSTLLADAYLALGDVDAGLAMVESGNDIAVRRGERAFETELHRLRGELLRDRDPAEAERAMRLAIELARARGALGLELRATTSLARLLGERGLGAEGRAALHDVSARCKEGFATPDHLGAQALLAALDA